MNSANTPTLQTCLTQVQLKVIDLKPEKFGPRWIRKHLGYSMYEKITLFLKKRPDDEGYDWKPFQKLMLPSIQSLWSVRTLKKLDYTKCVKNIQKMLVKNQPLTFNTSYLEEHCRYEFDRIRHEFLKTPSGANWDLFIKHLNKKWQDRWRYSKPTARKKKKM